MNDQVMHFSFQQSPIRGALVQATQSYQTLITQQGEQSAYPAFIQQCLGEMSAILLLMASNLKMKGKMNLQIRGSGSLYSLFTEVQLNNETPLEIRGLARRRDEAQPQSLDLRDWVGHNASLAITLVPDEGKSYQGLVPIEHARINQCIEDYYQRSEQINTSLWTQVSAHSCAALMIQQRPEQNATISANDAHQMHLIDFDMAQVLANTLRPEELLTSQPEDLLYRLFHEFPVMLHAKSAIEYRCSCSHQKMQDTLVSLGQQEIQAIAQENPIITMHCQFCGHDKQFIAANILDILKPAG